MKIDELELFKELNHDLSFWIAKKAVAETRIEEIKKTIETAKRAIKEYDEKQKNEEKI